MTGNYHVLRRAGWLIALQRPLHRGLTDQLKGAFDNTVPVQTPVVVDQVIRDPQWLTGFTSSEGCWAKFECAQLSSVISREKRRGRA